MTELARATQDPSDLALIDRWLGGDERAATELVERHAQPLARFAASLGEWEHVDELVQDTFVRAFGSLDSFRRESSLRTWLFTILRRLHLDRRRAARRSAADVSVDDVDLATAHGALDELVAEETRGRLDRVVQGLTRMQREVFTLRVGEGLSYREIADVLDSTEGAARVHYHNALRAVKEALDD
jgi:RNA polymerase sigma-70 factor (ECF subfamily)